MRVGLPAENYTSVAQAIWDVIEPDLCGPIVYVPAEVWKPNDSFLESLENGLIDLRQVPYITGASQSLNYSMSIYQTPVVLFYRHNNSFVATPNWFSFRTTFSIFPDEVWLAFGGAFCLLAILSHRFGHGNGLWRWFEHFFAHNSLTAYSPGLYSLLFTTSLFTLHLLSLYQGLLLSSLVRETPFEPPASSLRDAIPKLREGTFVLDLLHPEEYFAQFFAKSPTTKRIRTILKNNPPVYTALMSPEEKEQLYRERGVLGYASLLGGLVMTYSVDELCQLQYIDTPFRVSYAFELSTKIDPNTAECINEAISMNLDQLTATIERYETSTLKEHSECLKRAFVEHSRKPGEPIQLVRLSAVFLVVVVGGIGGLGVLCCERVRIRRWVDGDGEAEEDDDEPPAYFLW